jgi:hypothetical protein
MPQPHLLESFLNYILPPFSLPSLLFPPYSPLYLALVIFVLLSVSHRSALSKMVYILKPTDFGGWGRKAGPYGGLRGVEFSARCPPPIEPHTRIVAVCGINDFKDASSPGEDGWFHSDFYLFHHLFSDLSESNHSCPMNRHFDTNPFQ